MVLFDPGSPCPLCGSPITLDDDCIAFTYIGSHDANIELLDDGVVHRKCLNKWEHRNAFVEVWNSEANGLGELEVTLKGEVQYKSERDSGQASGGTWLAILVGVLAGMFSWFLLSLLRNDWVSDLASWIFGEQVDYKSTPGYYYGVLRSVLLGLCTIGGSIGMAFSRWRKLKSVLFLSCVLLVMAAFLAFIPEGISFD